MWGKIGQTCCTFIPNNTSPDGTVVKTALFRELAINSGIHGNPFGFLEAWFGKWSGMVRTFAVVLITGVCLWLWFYLYYKVYDFKADCIHDATFT